MKDSIALQIYSVSSFAEKDFKGTLVKIKEMGYGGVEFDSLYGFKPAEVKDMLCEVGLTPVSAHVSIDDLLEDPDNVIGAYAEIGCKYIAIPYLEEDRRPAGGGFENTIKDIETVAAAAKKFGIQMLYHNHNFEFEKIDGEYALDVLYNTISEDLLKTEIDTCWVKVAGEDPSDYIKKYSGRSPIVHLKDFVMSGKEKLLELPDNDSADQGKDEVFFEFRPVGYGDQDFPSILKASDEAGVEWIVVEQDQPSLGKNALECAAMSLEYLNKIRK